MQPELVSHFQRRTAEHYDAHPFEFLRAEDQLDIEAVQPAPFVRFLDEHARSGMTAADIGCGPGRGTLYLSQRGLDVAALDLSANSLELARTRAPRADFVRGSALTIPFKSESFDLVVSDGVIHHTPDPRGALAEHVRIMKPAATLYLGIYKRTGHYFYMYSYVGAVLRTLEKSRLGRAVIFTTAFPVYYAVHALRSRGKRTLQGAINFFYDYFLTPLASFHGKGEIVEWARQSGLILLTYDGSIRNVHVFVFQKSPSAAIVPTHSDPEN